MVIAEEGLTVEDVTSFLDTYYRRDIGELVEHFPREQDTLLIEYDDLTRGLSEVAEQLLATPTETQPNPAAEAIDLLEEGLALYDLPVDVDLSRATVRVIGLPDEVAHSVGNVRVSQTKKRLIRLDGQVSKTTSIQPLVILAAFECQRCHAITKLPQESEDLIEPAQCTGCESKGPFRLDEGTSEFVDYQKVRLQTPPEAQYNDDFDVVLKQGLVNAVQPGDRISANAIMRMSQQADGSALHTAWGDVHSLDHLESSFDDIDPEDYKEQIEGIATSDDPYQLLIDSIVPSHEGDDHIKEAIALQMFSGVNKTLADGSRKRGTIHVFLCGDPSTGKSSFLDYAKEASPRGLKSTGNQSSSAGLTAAAVQDDFGGGGAEWSLEAGSLVKASGGIAAIDELDDMDPSDRAGMLEAMSDQTVSVSKAGLNATLPAQTTVLAAANPKHGRFDQYQSIPEQIDIGPVLLSRFDLIFTMKDPVDEERDRRIAGTVIESQKSGQLRKRGEPPVNDDVEPAIPKDVMQAYVARARDVVPVISEEASEAFLSRYLNLRQQHGDDDDSPMPVTTRMLEATTRLAEAAARVELSETITAEHARRAIRIHGRSMEDIAVDPETGKWDADIVETGASKSQHNRRKTLLGIITDKSEESDKRGASVEEVRSLAVETLGMDAEKVDHDIEKLLQKGDLYEPETGRVSVA